MSAFRLAYVPYRVRFKRQLVTGRAVHTHREGWWVAVKDDEGRLGFGEVAPLPAFGGEDHETAAAMLARLARSPLDVPDDAGLDDLAPALSRAGLALERAPCVHAGVELALLDAIAAHRRHALAHELGDSPAPAAALQRLLTALAPDEVVKEGERAVEAGFTTLKLKVGALSPSEDLARVSALRSRFPAIRLRLDANGAWSEAAALAAIDALAPFGIDLLEQPIEGEAFEALRGRGIPIAADEALLSPSTASRLIAAGAVDALVLKPMLLGGLGTARALAARAQERGIRVVVTSSLDRIVGVAAALHLACALETREPAGLSTLSLLDCPDAQGPLQPRAGALTRPAGPGLGVRPPDDAIATLLRNLERC
ncbi:MAG TPA: o-succinylbenzoate synthase [Pantanalinema sp.]